MSLFMKRIIRESHIDVVVEADDAIEADKLFDDWTNDPSNSEDYNCLLSERETERHVTWCRYTGIHDRDNIIKRADFKICKQNDLKYDLIFCYDDPPAYLLNGERIWKDLSMREVIEHIQLADMNYVLKPINSITYVEKYGSEKRDSHIIKFELIRRTNNG